MHPPRIKSAPAGRLKSKKTSVLHDIEEWVLSGKEHEPETSRIHSGQLAENITEERLLRARMMELGKERFKILSKYDHEIQTFKDKQKRKGFRIKFNRPQSASFPAAAERRLMADGPKSDTHSASSLMFIAPMIRPKTVQFEAGSPRRENFATGNVNNRPRTVPAQTKLLNQTGEVQVEDWTPLAMTTDWSRPSTAGNEKVIRSVSSHSFPSFISARNQKTNEMSISKEPRFFALENSLSKNYKTDCKTDVQTIIRNIEALRKPIKIGGKEARKELELKVKIFMEENNIVF
ncbi:uncharacterized protein LOC132721729 [Ruditapes philippinarum]|uniref:uncharacterized protein LOC132721729 n=1 Tax=Ruditapes philippinarum TaxID=129788 RepID=UPI00295B12F3|nr:uncharacterized protein LOC132721729 [Ruditapes philippinarum]